MSSVRREAVVGNMQLWVDGRSRSDLSIYNKSRYEEGMKIEEICAPGLNGDSPFLADSRSQTALAGGAGIQVDAGQCAPAYIC
jgi:hypothetical protein